MESYIHFITFLFLEVQFIVPVCFHSPCGIIQLGGLANLSVCQFVCLSVSIFYEHPLMTHQSLSPLIFFFLSSGLVFLHKLYLGQEIRQPKDDTDHPKKKQGNEAVLVLYEYIHMFECFWVPANLFFLPLTWLRCRSAQIKIGGLSLLVIFTNPCHHLSWSLD